jgi:hypothetical protein
MREAFRPLLAAAAILASALPVQRAAAMTFAAPAAPHAAPVQQIVNICGPRGCLPVQTKRVIHHQKPGNTVPHRT